MTVLLLFPRCELIRTYDFGLSVEDNITQHGLIWKVTSMILLDSTQVDLLGVDAIAHLSLDV